MITGQILALEGAIASEIMRHFNYPVKVRKIHYQVVEGKQLAEISPTVSNHWYSIHYMLEWFQEQQKTVHCYNAKDKKGNSACRTDFPSQQSEHFGLRFSCPDELVTGEVKPWPRTSFSEKTRCSLWTSGCLHSLQT